jgi:metal-responsive CopG/Arc/MetJ family transcriptional regulator
MRLHITLGDDVVEELDRRVGLRRRSAFIAMAVSQALEDESRWESIKSAIGSIDDQRHEWDEDPAGWAHAQRRADERRVG